MGYDTNWGLRILCVRAVLWSMKLYNSLTKMFSGLNVTALIMIFLFVPETKQRTLEELDYIFAVPTRVHMKYQVCKALPYWFKRYVFRMDVELEPLYKLGQAAMDDKAMAGIGGHDIVPKA